MAINQDDLSEPIEEFLSYDELDSLNKLSKTEPLVRKLLEFYLTSMDDAEQSIQAAVNQAAKDLSQSVFDKTLAKDKGYLDSVMVFLEKGGKIIETIRSAKTAKKGGKEDLTDFKYEKKK